MASAGRCRPKDINHICRALPRCSPNMPENEPDPKAKQQQWKRRQCRSPATPVTSGVEKEPRWQMSTYAILCATSKAPLRGTQNQPHPLAGHVQHATRETRPANLPKLDPKYHWATTWGVNTQSGRTTNQQNAPIQKEAPEITYPKEQPQQEATKTQQLLASTNRNHLRSSQRILQAKIPARPSRALTKGEKRYPLQKPVQTGNKATRKRS